MKKSKLTAIIVLLSVLLGGCGSSSPAANDTDADDMADTADFPTESAGTETEDSDPLRIFSQDDVAVTPEITEYRFEEASEIGTVQKLRGMLPGAAEGTWYSVSVDGVEYYYGAYDPEDGKEPTLYGYAIFSDAYSLSNGITVGMTQEDLLALYPDMAVTDFEGNDLHRKISGNLGWNASAYPRSYDGMDSDWDYVGKDYVWSDRFDHLMIANIDLGEPDALPLYLALLIKDQAVAAITFYYPTAN